MTDPIVIEKSAREVIRLSQETYEGHSYIDARIYYWDGETFRPTRKGLAIRPDLLGAVIDGLVQMARAQ
jgi:hypothetical protein